MPTVSVGIKCIFFRGVLPVLLLSACIIRPSVLSLVYGILALVSPLLPPITQTSGVTGLTKAYLGLSLVLCCLFAFGQLAFQIYIGTTKPYGSTLPQCNNTEVTLRQFGFQKFSSDDVANDIRVVLPEVLTFIGSILTFFICVVARTPEEARGFDPIVGESSTLPNAERTSLEQNGDPGKGSPRQHRGISTPESSWKTRILDGIRRASDVAAVVLLCIVGTVWPCALSVFYFVMFLLLLSWWSLYQPVKRRCFNCVKMLIIFYMACHLVVLYLYQLTGFQQMLAPKSLVARLLGLTAIIESETCSEDIWSLKFSMKYWSFFVYPISLLVFYFYLAYQLRATYSGMDRQSESEIHRLDTIDDASSVHEELVGPDSEDENTRKQRKTPRPVTRMISMGVPLDPRTQSKYPGMTRVLTFLVRNSFAVSLIAMMAWAILFHTWLECVWLIMACLIWVLPDSQRICFRFSPFIVFYAIALLVIQYLYSLNLGPEELEEYKQTGLSHYRWAYSYCVALWIKILLSIPFFVTMRLFFRERHYNKLASGELGQSGNYGTFAEAGARDEFGSTESMIEGTWLENFLGKYWIYLVALVLLLISIRNPVVMYNAGYMVFFLLLVIFLQVSAQFFVRTLLFYWTLLVVYSSVVLLWIYLYQFQEIPEWWKARTNLSDEWNKDLGLETYTSGTLLVKLLTPISFLVVVILQLKFYHRVFRKITAIDRAEAKRQESSPYEDLSIKDKMLYWVDYTLNVLWRIAEIHARKVVVFALFMLAVYEVSLVNLFVVIFVVIMIPCRMMYTCLCVITSVYLSTIVLAKMLFQMHFAKDEMADSVLESDCASWFNGSNETNGMSIAQWAGFDKSDNIGNYLAGYLIVLVLMAARAVVFYRQRFERIVNRQQTPARGVIFIDVKRPDADDSVLNCLKFFANYFFYKFGVEICFISTVVVAAVRMDGISLIYLIWLLVLFALPRRIKGKVWWIYVAFLSVVLPIEYASCLGLPQKLCIEYPWQNVLSKEMKYWLFLPDYENPPEAKYLIGDFFQLLFAVCQLFVFSLESGSTGEENDGGDNNEILVNRVLPEDLAPENPVKDYITQPKSLLDIVKSIFFPYIHWITLVIVFVAGLGAVSLFALGYLIAAFVFLWKGNETYLKPMRKVIQWWRAVAFYNICVILLKIALQVVACGYYHDLTTTKTYCWVVQLFSIACIRQTVKGGANENCSVPKTEADIQFDVLCFVFLLFQLRVFGSWYFKYVVSEFQAERILSSRGAVLVNQLIVKEMKMQNYHEERRLAQVKNRTRRIREQYEKTGGKKFQPTSYGHAKRAGDYHDFDYDPDLPGEDELMMPDTGPDEPTPGAESSEGLTPLQIVHTAVTKDMNWEETMKGVDKAEKAPKDSRAAIAVSSDDSDYVAPPMVEEDETYDPPTVDLKKKRRSPKQKTKTSGSKDEEIVEEEKDDDKPKRSALVSGCAFIGRLVVSFLNWCTAFCNRRSRDHRYVSWVLNKEKVLLKRKMTEDYEVSRRSFRELRRDVIQGELGDQIRCVNSQEDITEMEKQVDEYWHKFNPVVRFIVAVSYLVVSRTELLCYLMMISDHMRTAAIISLPLPMFAFFWGTLCSPRPPKFFWIVVIAYTEAIVVVKFIFQFAIFSWNSTIVPDNGNPFWAPRILGIEKQPDFASLDVALLMLLFFHRYMLRKLGLWKDSRQTVALVITAEDEEVGPRTGVLIEDLAPPPETSKQEIACHPKEDEEEEEKGPRPRSLAYCGSFLDFYSRLLHPSFRYIRDLYSFMFLCDVFCFIICALGYQYFGVPTGSGNVLADVTSNRVPLPFVIILMVLTLLMIIDRALYLRKTTVGRLVFQYLLVIGVHTYIFFALPAITDRSTKHNKVAQFWYFVKSVYFLFSAWQIRNGWPSQILGNLLTRSYGLVSFICFKVFMAIPFLFELRTVIDWIWTDTSMPLFDFFNMESFYAIIYSLKCGRKMEQDYPAPRGEPKGTVVKYAMGGGFLIFIYGIIWLPMLLYALLNLIGTRNLPVKATFSIAIEGYPPLYMMDATTIYIDPMTETDYNNLVEKFQYNKSVLNFLQDYSYEDTIKVMLRPESLINWEISEPSKKALISDLANATQAMSLMAEWELTRPRVSDSKEPVLHTDVVELKLAPGSKLRLEFLKALKSNGGKVKITDFFPPFLIIPSAGKTQLATDLLQVMGGLSKSTPSYREAYADVEMSLIASNGSESKYWTANTDLSVPGSKVKDSYIDGLGTPGEGMVIVAFVDKVFPEALSSIVSTGIIAMYIAIVLLVSRMLRAIIVNDPLSLIISEMPYVDRVMSICLNLYLVREARDFALEQDLYAKIVFLFRSPETLIKWTRPKKKQD